MLMKIMEVGGGGGGGGGGEWERGDIFASMVVSFSIY